MYLHGRSVLMCWCRDAKILTLVRHRGQSSPTFHEHHCRPYTKSGARSLYLPLRFQVLLHTLTMSPVRQTVPSHSQAPGRQIKSERSIVNAKGIAGTSPSWPHSAQFFICPGPFDETACDILSQHADVKSIHKEGRVTTADSGTASGKRSEVRCEIFTVTCH